MFTGTVMLNENQENVLTIMPDVTGQGNANSSLLGIHTTSRLSFWDIETSSPTSHAECLETEY